MRAPRLTTRIYSLALNRLVPKTTRFGQRWLAGVVIPAVEVEGLLESETEAVKAYGRRDELREQWLFLSKLWFRISRSEVRVRTEIFL